MIADEELQEPAAPPTIHPRREPRRLPRISDEPEDYSDELPLPDNSFADCAAADWWAGRTR